jgi:signal transduction histidine kinase
MKKMGFFIMLAALILGISGLSVNQWLSSKRVTTDIQSAIADLKVRFHKQAKPTLQFNFQELLNSRLSAELKDPGPALPHLWTALPELQALVQYAESCVLPSGGIKITSPELKKAFLWHQVQCHQGAPLPPSFFESGPFMHPNGKSYAWLAMTDDKRSHEWVIAHQRSFHILELLNDPKVGGFELGILPGELHSLLNAEIFLLTSRWVFLSPVTLRDPMPKSFLQVFARKDWDRFILEEPWISSPNLQSSFCLLKESNSCWIANLDYKKGLRELKGALGAATFALLLFGLLFVGWRRRKFEKQLQAQRLFVVQMLTHELRTPATALALGLETFRQDFDRLPESSQKSFLQLSEEVQRLNRVLEASQDYLRADNKVPTDAKSQTSLNDLIGFVCEPHDLVHFAPLASNPQILVHRRWLELCLKNLVDNSLKHGKPPFLVSLREDPKFFVISVQDHGTPAFASLQEMSQPFQKSAHSAGLGLGLAVIQKVLKRMDAELVFESAPTTFRIHLRKSP